MKSYCHTSNTWTDKAASAVRNFVVNILSGQRWKNSLTISGVSILDPEMGRKVEIPETKDATYFKQSHFPGIAVCCREAMNLRLPITFRISFIVLFFRHQPFQGSQPIRNRQRVKTGQASETEIVSLTKGRIEKE